MEKNNKAINLFFCGMKHSGKTTHGKKYGEKKDFPFDDLDQWIEKVYFEERRKQLSCRKIFKKEGVAGFQNFETIALEKWLKTTETLSHPRILALGGGIASNQIATLLLTTNGYIVYLEEKEEILWDRMKKKGFPPYLGLFCKHKRFQKIYKNRTEIYEIIADCKIALNNEDQETNASLIEKELDRFLSCIKNENGAKK